jgi:CheY-like chemotaxis protein
MKSILLVDDEFDLTSTVKAVLDGRGYKTEVCASGREAVDHLRAGRPDLVLLDVMLPLGGGYSVLERLRAMPELAATPVVLMNVVPPPAERPVAWQVFLRKPLALPNLIEAVEGLIGPGEESPPG